MRTDVRGVRGRRDGRFAFLQLYPSAEIEPTRQLAGVAPPRRQATVRDKELDHHLLAREVVGQIT